MTSQKRQTIPVADLDQFEWLGLESLWGTAKSPYPLQWERWRNHPGVTDPSGNLGLVVGGNLWRANLDIKAADELGEESSPDPLLLSRAAVHLGKLAGGLIGITAHLKTPSHEWDKPLQAHIENHLAVVDETLRQDGIQITSTDSDFYYRQLAPVVETINTTPDIKESSLLVRQSQVIAVMAAVAVKTWDTFMSKHQELELEPGATPRSTGKYIEELRNNFEQYVPLVKSAARQRRKVE